MSASRVYRNIKLLFFFLLVNFFLISNSVAQTPQCDSFYKQAEVAYKNAKTKRDLIDAKEKYKAIINNTACDDYKEKAKEKIREINNKINNQSSKNTPAKPAFSLSARELSFSSDGSEKGFVIIKSNVDWQIERLDSWVMATKLNKDSVLVTVEPNTSTEDREDAICFRHAEDNKIINDTVFIRQSGAKAYLKVDRDKLIFSDSSDSKYIQINSNCKWHLSKSSAEWVEVKQNIILGYSSSLQVSVKRNPDNRERNTYLSIESDCNQSITVDISQEAALQFEIKDLKMCYQETIGDNNCPNKDTIYHLNHITALIPKISYYTNKSGKVTLDVRFYNPEGYVMEGVESSNDNTSSLMNIDANYSTYSQEFNFKGGNAKKTLKGIKNENIPDGTYRIEIWNKDKGEKLISKEFTLISTKPSPDNGSESVPDGEDVIVDSKPVDAPVAKQIEITDDEPSEHINNNEDISENKDNVQKSVDNAVGEEISLKSEPIRWPAFYKHPVMGISFAGVMEQNFGSGNDANYGFQAGLHFQPCIKKVGLGLYTGIFAEIYPDYHRQWESSNMFVFPDVKKYNLYVPLDIAWCIPFGEKYGMYLRGGLGADYCFYDIHADSPSESMLHEIKEMKGSILEQRLYLSYEFGVDLRLSWLMLHATCQKGFPDQPYVSKDKSHHDKYEAGFSLMLPESESYKINREKYKDPIVGISFGYLERSLNTYNDNVLVSQWSFNGIQAGVHFQPCFDFGFGMYTGIFGEWYVSFDEKDYTEYNLYIPVDLAWCFPIGTKTALYLHGGLGADYSLYNYIYVSGIREENVYGSSFAYDRINISYEFGFNLRLGLFMLHATMQKGITKNPYGFNYEFKTTLDKFEAGFSFAIGGGKK